MKQFVLNIICIFISLFITESGKAVAAVLQNNSQRSITGTVTDGHHPITGANVFVKGTMDGALTDTLGRFSFLSTTPDTAIVCVTCIGFADWQHTYLPGQPMTNLRISLHEQTESIDEVVVTGSTFSFGNANSIQQMGALDVVLDGGSCGDIVAALQTLPGSQKVGEDGKLYVRGGSSEECQTYINGMHVMQPYTTTEPNSPARGRFSPFLFKGINFSLGGYDAEYGQALSSVLPMETTDQAQSDKLGVSGSLLDWNLGGTKSMKAGSLSANVAYTDLSLYNKLFPDQWNWHRPYRGLSMESQWKMQPTTSSVWKTYAGYDHTTMALDTEGRNLDLKENNLYLNTVLKGAGAHHVNYFAGAALSSIWQDIDGALTLNDHYGHRQSEIHLKAKATKVISPAWKVSAGVEDYLRHSRVDYRLDSLHHSAFSYQLPAAFAETQVRLFPRCYAQFSARTEYATLAKDWSFQPRFLIDYRPLKGLRFTASAGRYSQEAADTITARANEALKMATADHYILGFQYGNNKTIIRLEAYYKNYHHLPWLSNGVYTDLGHGNSRGIDFFLEDQSLNNLTTTVSYSYNDSHRLYLNYDHERMPDYASRHNLRVSLKYGFNIWNFALTDSYASGRNVQGRKTPFYNSLDASITCLVSKRVIVYTSLSNLLGRTNIYGYRNGHAITNGSKRFFYIGIFVSLKSNKAYDISNF
ncbi:MAG: TonB-dependent receptor [Prevotella sp.]